MARTEREGLLMKLCNNTSVVIALPENPLATEQFAAEELAKYLKQSIGIDAPITNKVGEGAYPFVIGCPARNAAACAFISAEDFAATVPGPEGLYISIGEQGTLIAGSEDGDGFNRGALYAVYEYLERYWNCCFGAYTKPGILGGEIVPTYDELTLPNEVYCKEKCDLITRGAILQYNNWVWDAEHELNASFFDYLVKNRYNAIATWVGIYEQWKDMGLLPELEKRGLSVSAGHHHAFTTWLPPYGNKHFPTRYVEEYPEYFRLQEDGTRWKPDEGDIFGGQIAWCCHNMEMIDTLADNISRWLDKNPVVRSFGFPPNDGKAPVCCCDGCKDHTKMENYLFFANNLIERVQKRHPLVRMGIGAYSDLHACPEDMQVHEGLSVDQSVWGGNGLRYVGSPDGSGFIGTEFDENMQAFRKKCEQVTCSEYHMGIYGNRHRVMPCADEMQAMRKYFIKQGYSGGSTQIECFNVWNNLLNFYCYARVGYDVEQSLDMQIRAMCRLFGKGAPYVEEILKIYEDTVNGEERINKAAIWFREHVDAEKVYDLYEKALAAAGDDGVAANNVRLMRMAFRYSMIDQEVSEVGDPVGEEIIYMARNFNSYMTKTGYGITIAVNYYLKDNKFNIRMPEGEVPDLSKTDKWYAFAD